MSEKDIIVTDDEIDQLAADLAAEDTSEAVPAKAAKGKDKGKSAKAAKSSKDAAPKEKAPRPTFDTQSAALFHKVGDAELALTTADADRKQGLIRKEIAASIDGAAKKVQEKAVNIIAVGVKGGNLSNYTRIALDRLLKKGKVSSAELVETFVTDSGYTEGTARSQAGQMMQLFPMVGIASRDGKNLTLNKDSVLASALKS